MIRRAIALTSLNRKGDSGLADSGLARGSLSPPVVTDGCEAMTLLVRRLWRRPSTRRPAAERRQGPDMGEQPFHRGRFRPEVARRAVRLFVPQGGEYAFS